MQHGQKFHLYNMRESMDIILEEISMETQKSMKSLEFGGTSNKKLPYEYNFPLIFALLHQIPRFSRFLFQFP